ncbi:DUF4166 domain-containing protein [Lysobacter sp. LF1]|uniref:DUF4166 domain-containing protein n=1 Tax=Lysobacter stagni TaxID=3045172 RepID=A0ABT6XEN3_9GAMM|nr:DUF4166 domain-containing protein [Lysobacter sp. LF1]MDI9238599.1 DUF4166 domain-containing protein [Lysobacter sp. LF1]
MHAVERWFGEGFDTLHPRLRELHRRGSVLRGEVVVTFGAGLSGWIGRRLARRMGAPDRACTTELRVDLHADNEVLHWHRTFGGTKTMLSRFVPVGAWPDGHWLETTGPLRLALSVDTASGGWRWCTRRAWLHGLRVPLAVLPRVQAGKRIDDAGGYVFEVSVSWPLLGTLFAYSGRLAADPVT